MSPLDAVPIGVWLAMVGCAVAMFLLVIDAASGTDDDRTIRTTAEERDAMLRAARAARAARRRERGRQ